MDLLHGFSIDNPDDVGAADSSYFSGVVRADNPDVGLFALGCVELNRIPAIAVNYNELLSDSGEIVSTIVSFLGRSHQASAMIAAVDLGLYRSRSQASAA